MKKIHLFPFLFLISNFIFSQEIDLSNWKKDSIPIGNLTPFSNKPGKLVIANHSKDNWSFKIKFDSVYILNNKDFKIKGDSVAFPINNIDDLQGKKYVKKVDKGFLIGSNAGEFGGNLKFISHDNNINYNIENASNFEKDKVKFSTNEKGKWYGYTNKNIQQIFDFNNKVYATKELTHLSLNYGSIIEIFYENEKWKYKLVENLIESSKIAFEHNGLIYIITSQYILNFDKNSEIKQVLKSVFNWGNLYPSSAFIKDKDIYIAMRKGILVIRDFENNPDYEWYVKKIL